MNKRIKELVEQSYKEVIETNDYNGDAYTVREFDQEKFAVLIVRECARLAIEKQTENDILNIVSKNPAKDFAYALVEHFGVGE